MSTTASDPQSGALPHAVPTALATLLDIVPGSVVSRTLVKRKAGTVTLFSFDAGQGLSEHTAPFDALVLVLAGSVELTIGSEKLIASAGQAVVMPANVPHALHAVEPFKMLLTMIREAA